MSSEGIGGGVPSPFGRGPLGGVVGGLVAAAKGTSSECESRVPGKRLTRRKSLEISDLRRVSMWEIGLVFYTFILRKTSTPTHVISPLRRGLFRPISRHRLLIK